jgi:membrane fusion protein, multidrug efflux system
MVKPILKTIFICFNVFYFGSVQALTLNGFTEFSAVMKINARTAGIVQSVDIKTGQQVRQGDVLFKLDATPYQAKHERAKALASSLQPALSTAQFELDRAQELYDRDSLSQVEFKNAENKAAAAEGAFNAAQADVRLARYQLQLTQVKSPMNARVIKVSTGTGQYVDPAVDSSTLITLVSANSMNAVAVLNSDQWHSDLLNKKATVKYRNKVYNGKVTELGYQRVQQAGGLPAYEVRINFATDDLIPAEMPVSIEIKD